MKLTRTYVRNAFNSFNGISFVVDTKELEALNLLHCCPIDENGVMLGSSISCRPQSSPLSSSR
jgi:hypothetical protein